MNQPEYKSVISKLREILEFVSIDYTLLTESANLTPLQFEIIMHVSRRKVAIGDIAEYFWLDASTTSRIINRLKQDQWVDTIQDEEDKRRKLVFLVRSPQNISRLQELITAWSNLDAANKVKYAEAFNNFEEAIRDSEE